MKRLCVPSDEQAAFVWPESAGWTIAHGPDTAPDVPAAEHADPVQRNRDDGSEIDSD